MAKKETTAKELKEQLFLQKKNAYLRMSDAEIKKCDKFCEGYKAFLDRKNRERMCGFGGNSHKRADHCLLPRMDSMISRLLLSHHYSSK